MRLGVNIDHVATIRQARRTDEPDPVEAAFAAGRGGADGIVIHLREDRRHIQDRDLRIIRQVVAGPLNLEMAAADEIVRIALEVRPDTCTLVPERRQEVTTEGGLDVAGQRQLLRPVIGRLRDGGIRVSLFIDPDPAQIDAARELGADAIELHTGAYAAAGEGDRAALLELLATAARRGTANGLEVAAGHGLTYRNTAPVAAMADIVELNIGHSIVSRAVFTGLERAVADMVGVIRQARRA
jgi:pyridoxine 5-phosphate synthase